MVDLLPARKRMAKIQLMCSPCVYSQGPITDIILAFSDISSRHWLLAPCVEPPSFGSHLSLFELSERLIFPMSVKVFYGRLPQPFFVELLH